MNGVKRTLVYLILITYISLTGVFLLVYSREQYEKESTGILTIGFNVTWLITASILIRILYGTPPEGETKNNSNGIHICTYKVASLGIFLGGALSFLSLGSHCEFSSCFQIETPLYVTTLIAALSIIILTLYLVCCHCIVLCVYKSLCTDRKIQGDGEASVSGEIEV